ncbi:methylamine utilization protein MauE [Actinoplanes capillaceus]|uniref:Methylamine utilization protein MauE n=1 Tax=Actinoplanes campanulatus TaxID=113559 RepID=A0ABQ3WPF3_9ACTN|nr:MauE/DoxX family redox-associated membrane protein [Actinoplanes capillaceus]GID48133.1 methylamine utilization protein MauE [Actinoplanes capillaceus]
MNYVDIGCRALLTVVFAAAATGKVRHGGFAAFVASLAPIRWIGASARRPAALATVAAEALTVLLLWTPGTAPAGYLLAVGTLAAFTATLVTGLRQGTTLRCRCFGHDAGPVRPHHVARNLGLGAVAVLGLATTATTTMATDPAGWAIALLTGAVAGLATTRWDDIAFVLSPPTR